MQVRMQLMLPRDARYVSLLRNVAQCILTDFDVPAEAADDIRLALSEACANVVRHAVDIADYAVSLVVDDDGCEVEIVDMGPGFEPPPPSVPAGAEFESGRGLLLMRALVDDLQFIRQDHETRVRLIKQWPRNAEPTLAGASAS